MMSDEETVGGTNLDPAAQEMEISMITEVVEENVEDDVVSETLVAPGESRCVRVCACKHLYVMCAYVCVYIHMSMCMCIIVYTVMGN